jgi:O-antigen ligase
MRDLGRIGSFGLAAAAAFALTANAFVVSFHVARLGVVLVALLVMHLIRFARVVFVREALIYGIFLAYMLLELLWTEDRLLALNTLVPAANFVVILVLFVSLATFHDLKAVLAGAIAGFLAGAALYTRISGFPFLYPAEFSYNAIAGMYLFGFIVTLLLASVGRWKALHLVVAAAIGMHIVATTSIKTNLGILLGALTAGAVHFGYVSRLVWRNALVILGAAGVLAFAVASNDAAVATIERGANRVGLGIEILQARENLPGYSSFERRANWQREGFRGWVENPVFGHGVEAFRSGHGITSHASHVDIAYNSGLIGLVLFYSLFASMFQRLYRARKSELRNTRLIILGGAVCYFFISFAGTIHYSGFLAAFLALGIGILKRA